LVVTLRAPHRLFFSGLLVLVWLGAIAGSVGQTGSSSATFTTASESAIRARADHVHDWLRLYAQDTDPGGLTGYAIRRLSDPPAPCASGRDEQIAVDLGAYLSTGAPVTAARVITLMTPSSFPDGIAQVNVTAAILPDPLTGMQPLQKAEIRTLDGARAGATLTVGPGRQYQLDLRVRPKADMPLGVPYYPMVRLTVTFTGSAVDYYVYEIPMTVTRSAR
jgi:hypothetical protein